MRVQRKQCSTCIYRPDSPLDINRLEDEIRDENGGSAVIGFVIIAKMPAVLGSGLGIETILALGASPSVLG